MPTLENNQCPLCKTGKLYTTSKVRRTRANPVWKQCDNCKMFIIVNTKTKEWSNPIDFYGIRR